MTANEAIAAVERGERVAGKFSIHPAAKGNEIVSQCSHRWRTLFCNNVTDVIECSLCGLQDTSVCDFDEEYA
jgi:hypothetical protein